jgi:hypothetical protein
VEAAHDGRLDGPALAAFRQHRTLCPECEHAQRELESLRERLQAESPLADEVTMRRLRQLMLERVDHALNEQAPRAARWRRLSAALVLAAVGGGLGAHYAPLGAARTGELAVVRAADADTKWARRRTGDTEEVRLSDGVLSLLVRRRPGDPRVIVRVPDGEIEDQGTAFRVKVVAGRTAEISVSEGWVVFRRHSQAEVRLPAGSTWTPHPEAPHPSHDDVRVGSGESSPPAVPVTTPAAPAPKVRPRPRSGSAPAKAQTAAPVQSDSLDLEDEDEAYLQLLRLVRRGHDSEARLAAARYLDKFPRGFRRVEVERLVAPR